MEWWRAASGSKMDEEEAWLPPGFRFHPTDEELVTFYLRRKVQNGNFTDRAIAEVDFNKVEPWDLPGRAKTGEKEWYFFSLLDRKYPTGMRTNRATDAGYWKATGKDREITCSRTSLLLGMKKTLVFYKGRAPKGEKTNWVIHEYRLEGSNIREFQRVCKEEWVVCRVFKKSVPTALKSITALEINRQPSYELDSSLPALESPHMAHLPSSSPSAHQQETPLFHNHCYDQTNKSFGVLNRDSIALGSSLTCLPLPNSSFNISSTSAPFCSLQQEAGPGFNKNKANNPLPFLFPSLSSHYNLPNQQQYSYPPADCKIETLQQTCVNSDFTATQGNMFGRNAMNAQNPGKEATCTVPLFNEAVAIPLDPIPTGPCKPHNIPDAIPLDAMSTGTCLSHAIPVSISIDSMSNGTCMPHVIPPEFDSLWAF